MLKAQGLGCVRGSRQLFGDLSFSLHPSELLHIQGPNGSGKTSLLRILTGLSRPESGEIFWQGDNIREVREAYASSLLYLGHQPAVKDDLSAAENLEYAVRIAGIEPSRKKLEESLDAVGLGTRQRLLARFLSQGQRRRLSLARLWLEQRSLWILDEPFTALDVQATLLLEARLEGHLAEGGMVVLTTHQSPAIAEGYVRVLSLDA